MTREEAIEVIKLALAQVEWDYPMDYAVAFDMAIKAIEQEPTTKNDLGVDCISRKAVDRIINKWLSYPEYELKDHIYSMTEKIHNLPSVTPQEPRWIPVSERLPNWDMQCLVIDGDGEYGVGYYREDAHAWDSPNWGWLERKDRVDNKEAFTEPCGIGKVIAWMPLPKPYMSQESEG